MSVRLFMEDIDIWIILSKEDLPSPHLVWVDTIQSSEDLKQTKQHKESKSILSLFWNWDTIFSYPSTWEL
jgi:hypothetical protein